MKRIICCLAVVLLFAGPTLTVCADIIVFDLQPADFADLGVTGSATDRIESEYDHEGTFTGTVISQAFSLVDGRYLYLYQVDNHGPAVLELIWISPFHAPDLDNGMGYLTENEPDGFLSGGMEAPARSYDSALYKLSYQYMLGLYVPGGEHTAALYVISPRPPVVGLGQVMNSASVSVGVPVAVPEPVSLSLLAAGGLGLLLRRRRFR